MQTNISSILFHQGENLYIESLCQTILPVDEVIYSDPERLAFQNQPEEALPFIYLTDLSTCKPISLSNSCFIQGENPYIESLCQTILPVDEVIETLNDTGVDNNLKRPYLRFLLWSYLNTGVPAMESGILDLPEKMWVTSMGPSI